MIKVLDNVYDLVTLNMEQRFSERVALRFYDKETDEVTAVHYKDYARDIRRAVSYFQSTIPDIKGKKICLLNKNSYEYAVNTFGIILAGGVLVLLNQHKSWDELSYELGLVDPAAILTDGDDYGTKEQLQAAYGSILRPMDGFRAYEPVAEMPRCIGHDDLMILMFTSGTTGRSKGVMLSERNFFSVMRAHVQIGERMMEYKHDPELVVSQYTVLPMFHLGAFICLFSWAHGGWALNISGDIRNFYKEIRRMPSQVMAVVPVIMNSLHKDVMRGRKERLGELWVPICSSAMFDPQVMLDMATNGMFVVQTYGATETCGDGIINYAQDAKHIGAVGQGNDYLDYKIEPDGELCIRGDSIMLGYYKDVNLMKGAIECADIVSTVSETYAQEIRYPYYAHGLDGILSGYWYKLVGITNGVDVSAFDPATDKALVQNWPGTRASIFCATPHAVSWLWTCSWWSWVPENSGSKISSGAWPQNTRTRSLHS